MPYKEHGFPAGIPTKMLQDAKTVELEKLM